MTPAIIQVASQEGSRGSFPRRRPPTGWLAARWFRSGGESRDEEAVWCRFRFLGTEPQGVVMPLPSRRTFLQTAVAAVASFFLPRGLRAGASSRAFWFLHTPTGESWAVDDPVAWSLENAGQPILERARERLVTLDAADPQRLIR